MTSTAEQLAKATELMKELGEFLQKQLETHGQTFGVLALQVAVVTALALTGNDKLRAIKQALEVKPTQAPAAA